MKKRLLWLFIFTIAPVQSLLAREISYDRYTSLLRVSPRREESSATHFLAYPLEAVRWPIDKSLVFIEKHQLYDKTKWIFDQFINHGINPEIGGGPNLNDGYGAGVRIGLVKLSGLKERFPDLSIKVSGFWSFDPIMDYKVRILQQHIHGTNFRAESSFRYEDRGDENFYGIGPHTSQGDSTSYELERTGLGFKPGYSFLHTLDLQGILSYQNVNISRGRDKGKGTINEIFVASGRQQVPGLSGDSILTLGLEFKHDNRDGEDAPTQGGYEKFHFSYHKGMEHSTNYFKYRAEVSHFFRLFSQKRIVAVRGILEHDDEIGNREVPFFDKARLGGFGYYPWYSDTNRGFVRDRFYDDSLLAFNLEYRWTAIEYNKWRLDPALYWDVGTVFREFSRLKLNELQSSFGIAFRVIRSKKLTFNIGFGRSSEGTESYVASSIPF